MHVCESKSCIISHTRVLQLHVPKKKEIRITQNIRKKIQDTLANTDALNAYIHVSYNT